MCKNVLETDTFTCSNDQITCKINHKFDCNGKCLVYLITCNKCLKQYIGQTVDIFRSRWNNSSNFDRGEYCMQRHLYKHFQLLGHTGFLQDTYVTFIEKINPRVSINPEDYWIHTLKIKAPMGLNVKGGYRAPILHSYGTNIFFPGFGRLLLGLLSVYSDYCYIYFILSLEIVFVLFWLLRWNFLWQY